MCTVAALSQTDFVRSSWNLVAMLKGIPLNINYIGTIEKRTMQCPHCFPSLVLQGNHGYFDRLIEKEPTKSQLEIPAPKNIVVIFVGLTFVNLALFVIQFRLAHTLIFFQTYAFMMSVCPRRLSVDQTLNAQRTLLTRTCVCVTVATFWIKMGYVHCLGK